MDAIIEVNSVFESEVNEKNPGKEKFIEKLNELINKIGNHYNNSINVFLLKSFQYQYDNCPQENINAMIMWIELIS